MHHPGAMAYQNTAKAVETPREREAALLTRSANRLEQLKNEWESDFDAVHAILNENTRIWTVLLASVVDENNPLPVEIKQNVANLGVFVMNCTRDVLLEMNPDRLDPIISINRQLAAGLRGNG